MSDLKTIYSLRSANLRAVKKGLKQLELMHKDAIRSRNSPRIEMAARAHQFMVAVFAEARLAKTIYDPDGFNDRERKLLLQGRSQMEQWRRAVEYSFRRHFMIPMHVEIDAGLSGEELDRYCSLTELLTADLEPLIGSRNKFSHGEWKYQFTGSGNLSEQEFLTLNYVEIRSRSEALNELAHLINVLAVSDQTFKRDYESAMEKIDQFRNRFGGEGFDLLVKQVLARR